MQTWKTLSIRLDTVNKGQRLHFSNFFSFLFFSFSFEKSVSHGIMLFQWVPCTVHRTYKYFISKKNFKIESYNTIHTIKNYFVTVFIR